MRRFFSDNDEDSYPKKKRAGRKDQGQRKQTEFIIIAKTTARKDNQTGKET
jgi:hypothetical protein